MTQSLEQPGGDWIASERFTASTINDDQLDGILSQLERVTQERDEVEKELREIVRTGLTIAAERSAAEDTRDGHSLALRAALNEIESGRAEHAAAVLRAALASEAGQ